MSKIILEVKSCKVCPHHYSSPYPTDDSFERPEYYWCKNPDVKKENQGEFTEDETKRLHVKRANKFNKLSFVAGYVEWRDTIPVPDWCPIKVKE